MKKRIVCFVLTLIMLISLVPVSALSANAASNAVSSTAIYVLKQLEGYQKTCENGYIGYGAKCPNCLGKKSENADVSCGKIMFEKEADSVLRKELETLDKAVNSFADRNGLSFSQNQHDALVLFSFQNGTAWTLGTGAFQTAIKSGYTGSKFLDAICKWNIAACTDENDDNRRMIEANMYLNGVYSSAKPSRFIRVFLDATADGVLSQDNAYQVHYFDVATPVNLTLAPTPVDADFSFLGWYLNDTNNQRVTALTSAHHGKTLVALYQDNNAGIVDNGIQYTIKKSSLQSTTVYSEPNGTKVTTYINKDSKEVAIKLTDVLYVLNDYVDTKGVQWALIVEPDADDDTKFYEIGWVMVKGGSVGTTAGLSVDVNVTVTNTYVNMRKNASITATKNGSFNYGDVLRIIDTKSKDGFLWGQVATSADDETPIGWVALMYTDYDSVIANSNATAPESAIATATIVAPIDGYVNVRSDAGINNQIVGALSYGVTVDLYETKYVNGIRWGRTDTGWFCLTYARVTNLDNNAGTGEVGFTNYIYIVKLLSWNKDYTVNGHFYNTPNGNLIDDAFEKDAKGEFVLKDGNKVEIKVPSEMIKVGSLRAIDNGGMNETWAYTPYGWLKISENNPGENDQDKNVMDSEVELQTAKYYAIDDDVTVRMAPKTNASRKDLMIKGTEFNVNALVMVGESIWGYAEKVGEIAPKSYIGWVNLSNQNVSRNAADDFNIEDSSSSATTTVKMAKVVGTESLRVRITGATYGKQIGSLSYGTTAKILEEKNGWYNLDIDVDGNPSTGSWVSGSYLEIYDEVVGGTTSGSAANGTTAGPVETGKGIVANTYTGVNIRTAPGTGNAAVGKYMTGTTVEILEVKTHGAAKWGRTEKGWVCMDYIVMVDKYQTGLNAGTGSSATTSTEVAIYTGYVTADTLVYKNTNTASNSSGTADPISDVVRELAEGDRITLHEIIIQEEYEEKTPDAPDDEGQTTTIVKRTSYWARINEGYIFAPASCIVLDTLDEHAYTVKDSSDDAYTNLNVDGIGEATFKLSKGQKVIVTQLEIRKSAVWGFVEIDNAEGWVPMSRMTKGFASSVETEKEEVKEDTTVTEPTAPSTVIGSTGNTGGYVGASGYKYTGKVINTNQVNVRATASTTAAVTTTLKSGAPLVIYDTAISENMAWGRCDAGWVYLYYVDLTPAGSGAVDARVVYNDNTVIYKDMGMTEGTGSTYAKMAVVDIYEIVGKMARTELGWIHMDNLL